MLNLQTLKIRITPKIKTKSKIIIQHGIKDGLRMQNHAVGLHESSSTSRLTRFRILTPVTNDTIIISMKAVNSSIFSKSPTVTSRIAVQRAFLLVLWGYGASKWIETKTLAPPTKRQPMHAPSKSHPFVRGNNNCSQPRSNCSQLRSNCSQLNCGLYTRSCAMKLWEVGNKIYL